MKKIYIRPNIEVINIGLQQMIANSVKSVTGAGGMGMGSGEFPGGSSDAKLRDWGDYEEDFNFDNILWKN